MNSRSRSALLLIAAASLSAETGLGKDFVEIRFNTIVREYCHVVRFPAWQHPPAIRTKYGGFSEFYWDYLTGDYEFRVPGVLSTTFLVRGLDHTADRWPLDPDSAYTTNLYKVDLADPRAVVQPGGLKEWADAAALTVRHPGSEELVRFFKSLPFKFPPSGDKIWEDRVSPDRSVAVNQSWSGKIQSLDVIPGSPGYRNLHAKLFFDVYDVQTGKKLVTIVANSNTILPELVFNKTGWVTERFFFIPLDNRRTRCLVCDFGKRHR